MVNVILSWKQWNSSYSNTKHSFKDKEEFDNYVDKASSDHSQRKLIGIIEI